MKTITKVIVGALGISIALSMTGCTVGPWGGVAVGNPFSGWAEFRRGRKDKQVKNIIEDEARKQQLILQSKSLPQVIYHIDNNRYLTLEDYSNCDDGSIYYNNDLKEIKTRLRFLSRGPMNYKGKFIWAAKNDDLLILPFVRGDSDPCGDSLRGCARSILSVSIDGGKKYQNIMFSAINSSDSKDFIIIITDDAIYTKKDQYTADKYVLNSTGTFIQSREVLIDDIFYKKMLAMGIPQDALDEENPLDLGGRLLLTKYSYNEQQLTNLGRKISILYYDIRNEVPEDKLPDLIPTPQSATHFICNIDLLPR